MRRTWRMAAWTLGAVLTLIVALSAAVLVAGNTARGRALIEQATAQLSSGHVRLSGLTGSFPAAIDLEQLQFSDQQGVWLTAEGISLRWSPLALLARHLNIERLQLARLAIERRPASGASQQGSSSRLPHIDIGQLSIDALELGPELTGLRATLSVNGTVHVLSLSNATLNVTAHRIDAPGDYEARLRCDPSRVDATLKLDEPAGGALGNLLKLPGLGALSVDADLNGPRQAERLEVRARAGELSAHAQGSVDLTRSAADLDYRLDAPAMRPREGLAWERIELQGRWQGALDAPHADAQLRIDRMQIGSAWLETLSATLNADRGDLAVHATAAGLTVPGPEPRLLAESPLRVDATMRLTDAARPLQLTAEHRLFSLQAHAVTAGELNATFDLRLPDLAARCSGRPEIGWQGYAQRNAEAELCKDPPRPGCPHGSGPGCDDCGFDAGRCLTPSARGHTDGPDRRSGAPDARWACPRRLGQRRRRARGRKRFEPPAIAARALRSQRHESCSALTDARWHIEAQRAGCRTHQLARERRTAHLEPLHPACAT